MISGDSAFPAHSAEFCGLLLSKTNFKSVGVFMRLSESKAAMGSCRIELIQTSQISTTPYN